MADNNNLNSPSLKPTRSLSQFKFWCQKVLPLVYDDSLSYYEVLGKMVVYLNQVIDNVNTDSENVETLKEAFDALEEYVAEAIQYDVHDLEEAVRQAMASAESAASSAESASDDAADAQRYATNAVNAEQNAHESAANAATYALQAIEAAGDARNSETNASTYSTNASRFAEQAANAESTAWGYAGDANTAKELAEIHALESEGYAKGTQDGVPVLSDSPYYEANSKYYSEQAEDSADSAEQSATDAEDAQLVAEGMAVGQQNGVDVDSDSPYYHNNAKYYAEQAGQASGLSVSLVSLTDTDIINPTNGQVLAYDETDQKWKNSDEVQGVTSLEALTDTDITNPQADQILIYDANNEEWINGEEREISISPTLPSYAGTKIWIDESQQTPFSVPTSSEFNSAVSSLNSRMDDIENDLANKPDSSAVFTAIGTKEDKVTVINQVAPSAVTVANNTEYYFTNVSTLVITYPEGDRFECWINIETAASGTIAIAFPSNLHIGDYPVFGNAEKWEVSIKNGVIIAGKVQ